MKDFLYRGFLNFDQDNYVASLSDFEKSIEQTSSEEKTLLNLWIIILKNIIFIEEYVDDESCSFTNLDSLPTYELQKLKIGFQKNIEEISQAIKLSIDSRLYFFRGSMYNAAPWIPKNNLLALDDLNKAIELDKENKDYFIKRGEIKLELNKNESAMEDFNKAIKINPDSVKAYSNGGNLKRI